MSRSSKRRVERAYLALAIAAFFAAAGFVGRHDYQEEVSKTGGISAAYIDLR